MSLVDFTFQNGIDWVFFDIRYNSGEKDRYFQIFKLQTLEPRPIIEISVETSTSQQEKLADQILSTFKFLDEEN